MGNNKLDYIMPVIKLMDKGHSHIDAFKKISKENNVAYSTVSAQCTRHLGISTDVFADLVRNHKINEFLRKKFPDNIELMFTILHKQNYIMENKHNTEKFDDRFKEIPHFKNHEQLIPWVGREYGINNNKRLLIIGESSYPFPGHIIWDDSEEDDNTIIPNNPSVEDFTNTVNLIDEFNTNETNTSFSKIHHAIIESGFNPLLNENMFRYFAYYNYFQKPVLVDGRFNIDDNDYRISKEVFLSIINILQPEYICIVSKLAFQNLDFEQFPYDPKSLVLEIPNYNNTLIVDFVPHPNSAHGVWESGKSIFNSFQTENGPLTGKEKFITFLKHYKIFPTLN